MEPFSVRVPTGNYPVLLAVIRDDVGAVIVSFGEGPPVSWRAARPDCFGVDSATGCLMDHKVGRFLRRKADDDKYERYFQRFRDALDESDGLSANYVIGADSGANVVLFHTWGGDCFPRSYFGWSEDGAASCLVVDMCLGYDFVVRVEPPSA
jgi:hypothetical protein